MNGYFKPLRRKIGVLTLLVACLFAAGWVRSYSTSDVVAFSQPETVCAYSSFTGSLVRKLISSPSLSDLPKEVSRLSFPITIENRTHRFDGFRSDRLWKFGGFHFEHMTAEEASTTEVSRLQLWVIPYWSIVIPLTLLSAWLLLSKPRTKAETKTTLASENV